MSLLMCASLVAWLGVFSPAIVEAQILPNLFDPCCNVCQHPVPTCTCGHAAPVTPVVQPRYKPVYETNYRQEQVTTYEDVPATEYRREARWQTVPVQTYENVTVDEGSYQTVWVPRLVTRQVARTAYQQQLAYETVPYQVTRRVPRLATRTVPYQTVRYVPEYAAPLRTVSQGPSFPTPQLGCSAPAAVPYEEAGYPTQRTDSIATMPALTVPTPSRTAGNSTLGLSLGNPYVTPPSDIASEDASLDHNDAPRTATRSGKFVPAPSAASVWKYRSGTSLR